MNNLSVSAILIFGSCLCLNFAYAKNNTYSASDSVSKSNYNVEHYLFLDNPDIDFEDPKMFKFYKNTENKKNFIGGKVSLGYIDLNKTGMTKDYKNNYVFFVVNEKTKEVKISPFIVIDPKPNKGVPNIYFKQINENTGDVCSKPNSKVVFFWNMVGGAKQVDMAQQPKGAEVCMRYYHDKKDDDGSKSSGWDLMLEEKGDILYEKLGY